MSKDAKKLPYGWYQCSREHSTTFQRIEATNVQQLPKPSRGKLPIDHAGKRFGRLVAIEYVGRQVAKSGKCGNAVWLCSCDCGRQTEVIARSLVDGSTRSCGCLFLDNLRSRGGWNSLAEGESAFNQMFGQYKRSAKARGYEFKLTREQFRGATKANCRYCGASPSTKYRAAKGTNGDYIGNGVDRINNSKGYVPGNVCACCKQCNIAKGVLTEL